MALVVKNLPANAGDMSHTSILAWRIPWSEEPGGLQSMGSQSWTRLSDFTSLQVRCMKQGTQSQCAGTIQRDGMGREAGGGVRDGGHAYTYG